MELLPQSLSNYITRNNAEDELHLDMMKDSAGSVALIFLAVTGSALSLFWRFLVLVLCIVVGLIRFSFSWLNDGWLAFSKSLIAMVVAYFYWTTAVAFYAKGSRELNLVSFAALAVATIASAFWVYSELFPGRARLVRSQILSTAVLSTHFIFLYLEWQLSLRLDSMGQPYLSPVAGAFVLFLLWCLVGFLISACLSPYADRGEW